MGSILQLKHCDHFIGKKTKPIHKVFNAFIILRFLSKIRMDKQEGSVCRSASLNVHGRVIEVEPFCSVAKNDAVKFADWHFPCLWFSSLTSHPVRPSLDISQKTDTNWYIQ